MADGERLRADAAAIRDAAIESVQPERLFASRLALMDGALLCDGRPLAPPLDLDAAGRIVVVGAGKAAAGMAAGVEAILGADRLARHDVTGLVSVPAGCGRALRRIEVRETRPAAANLPTEAVVAATGEMLGLLHGLGPDDVALAVISGGGSALLCQPRPGVPLAEKVAVARFLSAAGADIHELNTLRQAASVVKGGGLARACRAGRLLVLVLSDVIGDPLDVIASGPCMPVATAPRQALAVLERFGAVGADVAPALVTALRADVAREQAAAVSEPAGASAGACTGLLHAVLGIEPLLSGILMMTALASVNLVVLGQSNRPLSGTITLFDRADAALLSTVGQIGFSGAAASEAARLGFVLLTATVAVVLLYLFLRTKLGTAMRAGGNMPTMARALGRNTGAMTVAGLAIANALTALSGSLVAQYQGFADVQMGIGMIVWGMASVFLGSALVGSVGLGGAIIGTLAGSVTFRLLVATALRAGLDPDWLKFTTAVVVLAALVVPRLLVRGSQSAAAR